MIQVSVLRLTQGKYLPMAMPATPPPLSEALGQLDSLTAKGVLLRLAHDGTASVDTLASHPSDDRAEVQAALEDLTSRGYITRDDMGLYRAEVTGSAW